MITIFKKLFNNRIIGGIYLGCIPSGGSIGFCEGFSKSLDIVCDRKNFVLQEPFKHLKI
jgi:hypothetical protein